MSRPSLTALRAKVPLTSPQKKLLHALAMGFITGALTALQIGVTTGLTDKKALLALAIGVIGGGLSRAAGAVLAWMATSEGA